MPSIDSEYPSWNFGEPYRPIKNNHAISVFSFKAFPQAFISVVGLIPFLPCKAGVALGTVVWALTLANYSQK